MFSLSKKDAGNELYLNSQIFTFGITTTLDGGLYQDSSDLALLYGATVHVGNILGLTGTPWLATPLLWRSLDIILFIFDIVTAIALWRGLVWSIWLLFGGILLLQILPYTLLRSHFILKPEDAQVLNGLLGTEILVLSILTLLLWFKK